MKERNRPSEEGVLLGECIARFADAVQADYAAEFASQGLPVPQRCSTCAFRRGTFPNGCLTTTADALKCVTEGTDFLCHDKDAMKPEGAQVCVGWAMLVGDTIKSGRPFLSAPWPFSDELPTAPETP